MEPRKPPHGQDDEAAEGDGEGEGEGVVVEPHPFPEPAWVRIGSPVVALALAVVIFAGMFALAGHPGAGWGVLVASLVLQLLLMGGRGLAPRRAARFDLPALRWHQFVFMWSVWAGGTYLLGLGQDGDTFAVWLQIAGGVVVALVMVGALRLLEPRRPAPSPTSDSKSQDRATNGRSADRDVST